MNSMLQPTALQAGDEIRVIAPSRSLAIVEEEAIKRAKERFEALGLTVSISKHAFEIDDFASSSIESRIEDLHEAFSDPNVKGIMTTLGGFNSNQLLSYIDYDLIKQHPKMICGYSDITALSHALYKKTGLVTYSGPHFSTFGMEKGFDYSYDHFQKAVMMREPIHLKPSDHWSDDAWYRNQSDRTFHENDWVIIQEGEAEGTLLGGNLCTLNLLQGTEYMPSLANSILVVEDDAMTIPETFDRDLQSLLHLYDATPLKALIIGRFEQKSNMTLPLLKQIIASKKELKNIPIIANVNVGHTSPIVTYPVGGKTSVRAYGNDIQWIIN
ncbi:LD-carboxypeptidase [Priestia koreensis]|uniref:S66 family peptidase n=2 Tax=Priestia koreensis TaxID=284581 RepID=UPI0028F710B6|nr:LD-carboxypeptidase [Priestia koreensis]